MLQNNPKIEQRSGSKFLSGWYVTLISGHLCNAGANTNAIVAVTVAFCIRTSCSTSCSLLLIASATSWAAKLAKISCTQLAVKFHSLSNTVLRYKTRQDKTKLYNASHNEQIKKTSFHMAKLHHATKENSGIDNFTRADNARFQFP